MNTISFDDSFDDFPHFMLGLLKTHAKLEQCTNLEARCFNVTVSAHLEEMKEMERAKKEILEKQSADSLSKKTWSMISSAAHYLTTIPTLIVGAASLCKDGSTPGTLLTLASSTAGIAASALKMSGAYKSIASYFTESKELQEKIESRLEMGMYALTIGLGLAGIYKSYKTEGSAMKEGATKIKGFAGKALNATNFAKPFLNLKNATIKKTMALTEASMKRAQTGSFLIYQGIHSAQKTIDKMLHTLADLARDLNSMISSLHKND